MQWYFRPVGDEGGIELVGGPLDGRTALRQGSLLPLSLALVYLHPSLTPGSCRTPVGELAVCRYVREADHSTFYFGGSEQVAIPKTRYFALLYGQEELEKVLTLVTDERLMAERRLWPAPTHPSYGYAIEVKMKERAVEAFRRLNFDAGLRIDISDEEAWALVGGAIRRDVEWALLGSLVHIARMRVYAEECFGIYMPDRLEGWSAPCGHPGE